MATSFTMSRRTLLRGLIGGAACAVALPPLEAMLDTSGRAYADGTPVPKRFGTFFWGNGYAWRDANHADLWTPQGTEGGLWRPSEQLAPLAGGGDIGRSMVSNVSVITGLEPKTEVPWMPGGQADGHMRGVTNALSADRPRSEGFSHPDHIFALNRATLDQVIARHPEFYGSNTPRFRSLELGVSRNRFHDYGSWNCISYNDQESQNLPILSVEELFRRLFGGMEMRGDQAEQLSVLDAVRADAVRLRQRLGMGDRARLDAHLEGVGAIERELRAAASQCRAPDAPTNGFEGEGGGELLYDKMEAMARLLAVALQCDMTRVFTMMFTAPGSQTVFHQAGSYNGLHATCHDGDWEGVKRATIYTMRSFRRFLEILADTPDAIGGSVLDNTVILGTSEFAKGDDHNEKDFPVLLAGGGSGALRGGTHYHQAEGNLSRVHLTILRALGLPFDQYGFNGGETREVIGEVLR